MRIQNAVIRLAWQISKQPLGLNPLSLRDNKNYSLNENGVFLLQ